MRNALEKLGTIVEEPFTYELPPERIAQRPVHPADTAKLLVVDRRSSSLRDSQFLRIAELLSAGDLLILNDSRVIPVRLFGVLEGRETAVELLLLREMERGVWNAIGRPLKKLPTGTRIKFGEDLIATVIDRIGDQEMRIEFIDLVGERIPRETVLNSGVMPIPPYIRKGLGDEQDRADYQNIFARVDGSIAAPTAGLHFTEALLDSLRRLGVKIEFLTLHVGTPSFQPLTHEDGAPLRPPGSERYVYSHEIIETIKRTRAGGGRVFAVGTTCVRALESMAQGQSGASDGEICDTELFIKPGHEFQLVDGVITNFHQPRTTHLLLVQALLGRELLSATYSHALAKQYRFLSYGDGMIVV